MSKVMELTYNKINNIKIQMSRPTPTIWHCLNCNKEEIKPFWLSQTRKFCSAKCVAAYNLKYRPNYYKIIGQKASPEKISQTLKDKCIAPPSRLGIKDSLETKLKKSKAGKEFYANGGIRTKGKKLNFSPEGRQRKIQATIQMRKKLAAKGNITDIEKIVRSYFREQKIVFEFQYIVGAKIVDFYLPHQNIIVEADGWYWHTDQSKEAERDSYLKAMLPGVLILHFSDKEIKSGTYINTINKLVKRGV